ncbi:transmembrane protein, putative (macronuclear) [Tetrahymena thermophila SB210]|uniref:Transmembrane protein, putative n=1 Tax=Tetrahymena thermophila (strain SB210) TaxID=312017 RepID=I7LTG1_TETTS|nr:transmembrane protein, putative [Tetrahymena thermophila SB210]EAR85181.2 transmembrane protein, putative [Tetrahymena thermophila SB210]|eukprot:XP_001032844.2 transmembrane protein, putative [Tetrahymena thermophila SB210]
MEQNIGKFQFFNTFDQSSPENDSNNDKKMLVLLILIGFFCIYYLVLLYYHFTRRNLFPISERSYKLTLIDGICSMVFVNIVLISSIITNEHNFLLAPNFFYCSIDKVGLGSTDIEFYENNQYKANSIKAFQFLNNFLKFFKTINYLLRTFRLSYVFYFNIKHIEKYNSIINKSVMGKNSMTDINNGNTNFIQQNQNLSSNHQRQLNINVATYNTQNSYGDANGQQQNTAQNFSNHLGSHRQGHFQESLVYSDISFGNYSNSTYIPQTKMTYMLKRENLLIGISFLISIVFATIFYFIPSASPFMFWNIKFSSDLQDTHIYDNIIFICMNFILIIIILFCLMSVKNVDDSYKIKYEIYFMLAIFTIVGNIIQFECPEQDSINYVFDENSYPIFGLIPYRLAISGLLDFVAINIEILLPILYSSKERPFYNQNIVQDSLPFFCSKYKNFVDFLVYQQKPNQSQINSSSQCLAEILNLYIEMKNQNQNQQDIDQITKVFQKFDCLVPAFRSENVKLDLLFEIQDGKVIQAKENATQQSQDYQMLYQKTTEILEKYQKIFMKTPQYEFLFRRYQMQNQICLCLQDFNMTGDNSN